MSIVPSLFETSLKTVANAFGGEDVSKLDDKTLLKALSLFQVSILDIQYEFQELNQALCGNLTDENQAKYESLGAKISWICQSQGKLKKTELAQLVLRLDELTVDDLTNLKPHLRECISNYNKLLIEDLEKKEQANHNLKFYIDKFKKRDTLFTRVFERSVYKPKGKNNPQEMNLLGLPLDVTKLVFEYLGKEDFCAVEETCKQLQTFVKDHQTPRYWNRQLLQFFGKPLSTDPQLHMTKNLYVQCHRFLNSFNHSENYGLFNHHDLIERYGALDPNLREYPNLKIRVLAYCLKNYIAHEIVNNGAIEDDVRFLENINSLSSNLMPVREQTRIEAAITLIQRRPRSFLEIQQFGIRNQPALIEIANMLFKIDPEILEQQIQTFGIHDQATLSEFDRLFKIHHEAKTLTAQLIDETIAPDNIAFVHAEILSQVFELLGNEINKRRHELLGSFRDLDERHYWRNYHDVQRLTNIQFNLTKANEVAAKFIFENLSSFSDQDLQTQNSIIKTELLNLTRKMIAEYSQSQSEILQELVVQLREREERFTRLFNV